MATYVFRIHEPKKPGNPAPMSAANMNGWTASQHIAGNLLGNITLGTSGNKMGTSIPSIFARVFLFEGAFQTLSGQPLNVLNSISMETKLVSECLDLIEFLFQHGKDQNLVIKRWNAQTQIAGLKSSPFEEHKQLALVLEDEVKLYPGLSDIFLFYWKSSSPKSLVPQEFLIGGTSPFTLVFTSPNWKSIMAENGFSFNRLNGTPMFDENISSLQNRDDSFKKMLYSLHMAYNLQLSSQAMYLDKYIAQIMANDPLSITVSGMAANPGAFINQYTNITDVDGNIVNCHGIPLCFEEVRPSASGYEIIPTASRYKNYIAKDGTNVSLDTPLVLNDNGLGAGVAYIGTSDWDINTCKINEANVRTTELHKRILPGQMGVQYPYLIWSDFLEDKIVKLPYSQNSTNFITACDGDAKYVLPLKRNFFKYFNVEDIAANVPGTNKKYVEINLQGDAVCVKLNIPVRDQLHHFIVLERKYEGENIIGNTPFLLGFFPFYKVGKANMDRYNIMKCGSEDARLRFYNVSQIDSPIVATQTERTAKGAITSQTEYYSVKSSFDLVEISLGGTHGLIIPQMRIISNLTEHYKFAVDFGTSNTYIAHITNTGHIPTTLEVDAHDQQTVFLSSQADYGMKLNAMKSHIAREFTPVAIGKDANVSFPCRTAICEIPSFTQKNPDLFGTISVGFNMMNEPVASNAFAYKTGLKWLLEQHPGDVHHTNRVKYYFLQTLWMLKNESFLNGGDDRFDVYITFPETMKVPTRTALMSLWQWAKQELNLGCTFYNGTQYSESIAPYNCMATMVGGSSYLNIDIGGGTNDLLFVLKNPAGHITGAHYSSAMFAGDDLWGDGVTISTTKMGNNGFVDFIVGKDGNSNQPGSGILGSAGSYPAENISTLKALMGGISTSSADVMGYLFKNDNVFSTSGKIQGSRNLYSIVFIHYAAILYNVARLINKLNIEIPEKFSFTGMGSKYINLMSGESQVFTALTTLLLQKYTGKKVSKAFQIIKCQQVGVDVKEITAKGVLEGLSLADGFQIPYNMLCSVHDLGFDTVSDITYEEVSNDDVRQSSLAEFKKFVDSLKDGDFKNFLFKNFSLSISDALLEDLWILGEQSFRTMSASVPPMYNSLQVQETLFFWPLKNSLVELSRRYQQYN